MCLMQIVVGIHRTPGFQFQLDCCQMLENPCDWRWPSSAVNYSPASDELKGNGRVWRSCKGPRDVPDHTWPRSTRPVIRVSFLKVRFTHHLNWSSFHWCMGCYDRTIFENLRVQKNLNIEKIIFKLVQMKFLAMHITNQTLRFNIFMIGHLQNIFMEHDLYLISLWFLA